MRWLICLLLALLVIWQILPIGDKSEDIREVAKSSRRVLDAKWRALPEREMTIADMERYAAGLSDGDLWVEIDELSERWLDLNSKLHRPHPPRLVLILAREVGKRSGLSGLDRMLDYYYDLEDSLLSEDGATRHASYEEVLDMIGRQMEAAVFAGWIIKYPEEAILELLSWWEGYENNSVGGYDESLEDILRGQMVGNALLEMAGAQSERAFELLERAQATLPWVCRDMIGNFLLGVPEGEYERWRQRTLGKWPKASILHVPLRGEFMEVKKVMLNHDSLRGWEVAKLLGKYDPMMVFQLSRSENLSIRLREELASHLFYHGHLVVEEVVGYPAEVQDEILGDFVYGARNWDSRDFSGPIDGTESSREQDRGKRIGPLEAVLKRSALAEVRKAELLQVLAEVRLEVDEDLEILRKHSYLIE